MPKPTYEQLEKKVRELAAEKPDYVYTPAAFGRCKYNPDEEQAGCLWGQSFIALGSPVPEKFDAEDECALPDASIDVVLRALEIDATERQRSWALRAQRCQDRGSTWKDAIEKADDHANTYYLP